MAVSKFEQYVSQAQSHTQVMGDFPTIKCLCLPDTSWPSASMFVFVILRHNHNIIVVWIQVNDLAAGLVAMGLKKGDRVGMWGPNTREWVITQFATAKAGLVLVSYCCH